MFIFEYHICIGGLETWQTYTTLPNILKNFNPNLVGMSFTTTKGFSKTIDNYNIAIAAANASHSIKQANYIIKQMQKDPAIDFNTDWKMITVLIGHIDVCLDACKKNHIEVLDTAIGQMRQMLDTLYHGLPRTFVNLMPIQG